MWMILTPDVPANSQKNIGKEYAVIQKIPPIVRAKHATSINQPKIIAI
jgi:hypothetical protein